MSTTVNLIINLAGALYSTKHISKQKFEEVIHWATDNKDDRKRVIDCYVESPFVDSITINKGSDKIDAAGAYGTLLIAHSIDISKLPVSLGPDNFVVFDTYENMKSKKIAAGASDE